MKIKLTILFFILFILSNCLFSQLNYYVEKGNIVMSEFLNHSTTPESIGDLGDYFEGFFVIKFNNPSRFQDSTRIIIDSINNFPFQAYWINNINEINEVDKYFWYNPDIIFDLIFYDLHFRENTLEYYVSKLYTLINCYLDSNDQFYMFSPLKDAFYTTMLDSSIIWTKQNNYYVIYKCEFLSATFTINCERNYNNELVKSLYRTLIPLSKREMFAQLNEKDAEKYQLKKANIKIISF